MFDVLNSKLKISKSNVQSIESILKGLDVVPKLLLNLESNNTPKGMVDEYEMKQTERLAYYEALVQVGPLWKEAAVLHLAKVCQKGDGMSVEKAISEFKRLQSKIRNLGLDLDGKIDGGNYGNISGLHMTLAREIVQRGYGRTKALASMSFRRNRITILQGNIVLELRDHLRKCFPDYA